jgi:hypothetical protein
LFIAINKIRILTVYTKLSKSDEEKLVGFLKNIFAGACKEKERQTLRLAHAVEKNPPLSKEAQEVRPQAAAFLLSTGDVVGGIAMDPISKFNANAEDPLDEAMKAEKALKDIPNKKVDPDIVGMAITTTPDEKGDIVEVDLDLHHMSIINMENRTSNILLLVHPETGQVKYSDALEAFDFALKQNAPELFLA